MQQERLWLSGMLSLRKCRLKVRSSQKE